MQADVGDASACQLLRSKLDAHGIVIMLNAIGMQSRNDACFQTIIDQNASLLVVVALVVKDVTERGISLLAELIPGCWSDWSEDVRGGLT